MNPNSLRSILLPTLLATCWTTATWDRMPRQTTGSTDIRARLASLQAQAIEIRSIDPADDNFSDLMPLAVKIGSARIVQLGESTHGDGATFMAKTRLIKFLHQVMGFDVVAWESNIYECALADSALRNTRSDASEAASIGVYGVWSSAHELRSLFEYIRASKTGARPINLIGIDCQSTPQLADALFAYFERTLPGTADSNDRASLRDFLEAAFQGNYAPSPKQRKSIRAILKRLMVAASDEHPRRDKHEAQLIVRTLRNVLEFEQMFSAQAAIPQTANPPKEDIRDVAMGRNLAWLANKYYPDRKIIVWAANFHVNEDPGALEPVNWTRTSMSGYVTEGKQAAQLLGEQLYTIGFTAYSGSHARINRRSYQPIHIPVPAAGTFEDVCHQTGRRFLFVDLKNLPQGHWVREPQLIAHPIGYGPMAGEWSKAFDALFFIDEMTPATPLQRTFSAQ